MSSGEMITGDVFFVRHGEYTRGSMSGSQKELTVTGESQARHAAQNLRNLIGDKQPKVISSERVRAVETADIIADELNVKEFTKSQLLAIAGEHISVVGDLSRLVTASLLETDTQWNQDQEVLVLVSHQPLVTSVRDDGAHTYPQQGAAFCEVAKADFEAWDSHVYVPDHYETHNFEDFITRIEARSS